MSRGDLQGLHRSGKLIPVEIGLSLASHGKGVAVIATVTDISEKRRRERDLINANALMSAMIQSMPFSVITTDVDGVITALSPAAEHMLGYSADELIGRRTPTAIHDAMEIGERAQQLSAELGQPVAADFDVFAAKPRRGAPESRLWTYVCKNGSRLPVQLTVSAIRDPEQKIVGFLGIAYDASEQMRRDEYLSQLAYYDALTGLPNRTLMEDRFRQALERARRLGQRVALLLVDLDHFKQINDSLGHAAGDHVLITVGARLQNCVRASDTVARLGGDEFVVVLSDIQDADPIHLAAAEILAAISSPVPYSNQLLQVTPSIGISLFPDHGENMETLLIHADRAMYAVKGQGRAAARVYTEDVARRPD
jgi:diguanylate cyclase (GGDEF)-like protein